MDEASDSIFSLRPVTFRYKTEPAKEKTLQFGLIAEEVAKVNPGLVVRDGKGEIYSVRYEAVNAMMLNEFIKEHRQVQDQQKEIDKLTAQLKEQAAMLQKVSAQVELMKAAPRTVADSR
jgi:tRNA-dihydrouridine synthase